MYSSRSFEMNTAVIFDCFVYWVALTMNFFHIVQAKLTIKPYKPMPLKGNQPSECKIDSKIGLCMFAWECWHIGGMSLGICRDGILFGACCTAPSTINPSSDAFLTLPGSRFIPVKKSECGRSSLSEKFGSRIVNGETTQIGEFPWQLSVNIVTAFPVTISICGAVILTNEWAITAAHCVEGQRVSDIILRFGVYSVYTFLDLTLTVERRVAKRKIHPAYTSVANGHDLALLKVEKPVQFNALVQPICLPGYGLGDMVGEVGVVTGFGTVHQTEKIYPDFLQMATLPIQPNKECYEMIKSVFTSRKLGYNFICAGYKEGRVDTCQGDSGGPLQIFSSEDRWVLAGITSAGFACAKPNLPGIYTRISYYLEWILQTIHQ